MGASMMTSQLKQLVEQRVADFAQPEKCVQAATSLLQEVEALEGVMGMGMGMPLPQANTGTSTLPAMACKAFGKLTTMAPGLVSLAKNQEVREAIPKLSLLARGSKTFKSKQHMKTA